MTHVFPSKVDRDHMIERALLVIVDAIKIKLNHSWDVPHFDNEIFKIAPYSWDEENDNDDGFTYLKTGWRCTWYKHIGRGMHYDDITVEELHSMLRDCLDSIYKKD